MKRSIFKELPKDLKRFSIRKVLVRIIPCFILTAAIAGVLIAWGDVILKTDVLPFKISAYILFLSIPFVACGVPFKLINRSYYGTIEGVDIKTVYSSKDTVRVANRLIHRANAYYLDIKTDDGKSLNIKIDEKYTDIIGDRHLYKAGDRVFHLYGSKQIIVLPTDREETLRCPICGYTNEKENDTCRECLHTLIKSR